MTRSTRCLPLTLFILGAVPVPGLTQGRVPDLTEMSIEDLMNIEVTSASRKEQRAADVASAVFVITHDDIRRSGMTTIPDLLRLAPGVQVAQINSNKWAVSIRGFNSMNSNKLLVLVDGRSLYNRIFGGVFWDAQDLMLDDVDRIEVIRGPSAAMWGANAVNGVINIITRGAADTPGLLVRAEAGRSGELGAVRYGGTLGAASYRLYSQWTGRNQSLLASGTGGNDASHSTTTGFRADWTTQPDAFLFEGAFTAGQTRGLWFNLDPQASALQPIANEPSDAQGGHLLGRYTHTRASGASLQVQSFMDVARRQETIGNYGREVVDLDTQYHMAIGAHHDLVAGAGYWLSRERLAGRFGLSLAPAEDSSTLLTAFAQDEIALFGNRLMVTLGTQVQYVAVSGAGVQPTARVMWKARPSHRLWAATVSRHTDALAPRPQASADLPSDSDRQRVATGRHHNRQSRCGGRESRRCGSRIPARDRDDGVARRHRIRGPLQSPADTRTGGSHCRVRPVTEDPRRFARQQPARGDDARFRNCGPLDAGCGLAPRRQLHGRPCHPQPGNRESGSLRRRKRAARPVAGAIGVLAEPARDAQRSDIPCRSARAIPD